MNLNLDTLARKQVARSDSLLRFLLAVIVATAGVITAYHATIYGLKEQVATKANQENVTAIDSRLIRIEAILTDRVATKAELMAVRDELNHKLISIEARLQMLP
jgi:hypothetical protein